jgi:hypothetical protein
MASSKLLKEAIADAKAVRETAIANAKIALEEAFTPRLQSILSRKLQAEMEGDEEEADMNEDNDVSSEIGGGDNKQPAAKANDADTDLSGIASQSAQAGDELEGHEEVDDLMEGEDEEAPAMEGEDEAEYAAEGEEMAPEADEDELDLESIIRELEDELGMEESDELGYEDPTNADDASISEEEDEMSAEDAAEDAAEAPAMEEEEETIDLDEILREMGYGDDEEVSEEEEAGNEEEMAAMQSELKEAYSTIQSLRKTINEVNLLNAKLLYTNKLFRNYNLTNEQKVKVVENLDRTSNVREVKLVYATLSESMKFTGTERKVAQAKKSITEGLASKPSASTAPAKQIISENTNELANRFKQLAGIIK